MEKALLSNKNRMQRRIDEISSFTEIDSEITRRTYSAAWADAVDYLKKEFALAGMTCRMDSFGNLIGRYDPLNSGEKPFAVGSHLDSVKNAGKYDGVAGIVCGLEMVSMLHENGIAPKPPIEVIATADEEGAICQKGYFGARFMTGDMTAEQCLGFRNAEGKNIADLQGDCRLFKDITFGSDCGWAKNCYRSWLEIHVEQGNVLETEHKQAGIVCGVVGIGRIFVKFTGSSDHAGPTLMKGRQDSLAAAAALITHVWETGQKKSGDLVCTVARLHNSPNIHNVISGETELVIDYRSADDSLSQATAVEFKAFVKSLEESYGVKTEITAETYTPVKLFDKDMISAIKALEMPDTMELYSWAGHDAKAFANVIPTAMIFMPSIGGKSHSPLEFTPIESFELVCNNAVKLFL